jgi:antitoxin component of MazEF toxin-antitoxin module
MEATIVKIGTSLGVKVPEAVIKDFNLKAGSKIELKYMRDGEFIIREKAKA